jgi:hypothetical protein
MAGSFLFLWQGISLGVAEAKTGNIFVDKIEG